jgi:hypothetical protein
VVARPGQSTFVSTCPCLDPKVDAYELCAQHTEAQIHR